MSDTTDEMEFLAAKAEGEREDREEAERDKKWITKSGEAVFITDMTNSHLLNSINMLKRKGTFNPEENITHKELEAESNRRHCKA